MEILKIILATIVATATMTAFIYYVSKRFHKLFKEPVLLNIILSALGAEMVPERKNAWGWAIHFMIGLLFVVAYHLIWHFTDIDPTWFTGLIFGIISGLIGIFSWFFLFKLPPNPPKIHFKQYYLQLFIAHILFSLSVIAVYRLFLLFE